MNVGQLKEKLFEASRAMGYDAKKCLVGVRVLWGNLGALGKGLTPMNGPSIDEIQRVYSDEASLILELSEYGIGSSVTVQKLLDEVAKLHDNKDVMLEYTSGADLTHFVDVDGLLLDDTVGEVYLHPRDLYQNGNTRDQDVSTWRYGTIRIVE